MLYFYRGDEFRKDFKELSSIRAFFPDIPMLALTATATSKIITSIQTNLCMHESKIIGVNPNRKNIYLDKRLRQNQTYGFKGYENILSPLAKKFNGVKTKFSHDDYLHEVKILCLCICTV